MFWPRSGALKLAVALAVTSETLTSHHESSLCLSQLCGTQSNLTCILLTLLAHLNLSLRAHCSLQLRAASHSTVQSHPAVLIRSYTFYLSALQISYCIVLLAQKTSRFLLILISLLQLLQPLLVRIWHHNYIVCMYCFNCMCIFKMSFCIVVLLVNMCVCHLYNKLTYLLTYLYYYYSITTTTTTIIIPNYDDAYHYR